MKVFLDMVGCRLNQAEIEKMAALLAANGQEIVGDARDADVCIINTCCVTAKAAADSRKMIRHSARNSTGEVIATGCWATLFSEDKGEIGETIRFISNDEKETLAETLLGIGSGTGVEGGYTRQVIPGKRQRTRAFIKVQDGCDDHCTYCITRIARGKSRSIQAGAVIEDIKAAKRGGAKEAVLTGVQLGAWGKDIEEGLDIKNLIERILNETDIERIRLSSIEPWDIKPDLFELWQDARMCRHLHIPLQSGSERILQRMARRTTPAKFGRLIEEARAAVPGMAITTDVIVGFPGETEANFEETVRLIQDLRLDGGHVFTFSAMPGTAAAKFPEQVLNATRKERSKRLHLLFAEQQRAFRERLVGSKISVLWERSRQVGEGYILSGLTDTYCTVRSRAESDLWNQISQVVILGLDERKGLVGEILG